MMVGFVLVFLLFPNSPLSNDNVSHPVGSSVPEPGWSKVSPEPHHRTYLFSQLPHMAEVVLCSKRRSIFNQKISWWSGARGRVWISRLQFLETTGKAPLWLYYIPWLPTASPTPTTQRSTASLRLYFQLRAPPSHLPPPNDIACLLLGYSTKNVPLASATGQTLRRTISSMGLFHAPCPKLRQSK